MQPAGARMPSNVCQPLSHGSLKVLYALIVELREVRVRGGSQISASERPEVQVHVPILSTRHTRLIVVMLKVLVSTWERLGIVFSPIPA